MNCNQIEDLLPLHIQGDLEAGRARLLATHVQSCARCARAAEEYRETMHWLNLYQPPPFSETLYTSIRHHVLREINEQTTQPTQPMLLEFASRQWPPRAIATIAAALLLALSAFTFYRIMHRPETNQTAARRAPAHQEIAPDPRAAPTPGSRHEERRQANQKIEVRGAANSHKPPQSPLLVIRRAHRRAFAKQPQRHRPAALNNPAYIATGATNTSFPEEAKRPVDPGEAVSSTPATPPETLRIELQTDDPNIRIIWFSQISTNEDSHQRSTKD